MIVGQTDQLLAHQAGLEIQFGAIIRAIIYNVGMIWEIVVIYVTSTVIYSC